MRFVILHYHIFKNAGSTIEDILDRSFGARFSRLERHDRSEVIPNSEIVQHLDAHPKLRAISSHQIRQPVATAPGYFFFEICFLRDPLDRLRSYYDYFRQKPDRADPLSDLANRASLRDFAAGMIAGFSPFIRNPQVNFLACGGASDAPREADLALAIRRIMAMPFPGVVDCFDQSAITGAKALRGAFPELDCAHEPANVSRGMEGTLASRGADLRAQCGEDIYWTLREMTALDQCLVDFTRKEVLRRYAMRLERTDESTAGRSGSLRTRASIGFSPVEIAARLVIAEPAHELSTNHDPAYESDAAHEGFVTMASRMMSSASYWSRLGVNSDHNHFVLSLHRLWKGVNGGLHSHPLFDSAFYLRKYPDVAAAGVDPLCHYLEHGSAESRQPHSLFDPAFYLSHNPDVKASGADPLIHYLEQGAREDRKPHPLFEPAYYRVNGGMGAKSAANPLLHFLEAGANAAQPHPLFDCGAYLRANPEVAERGWNPLVHYLDWASGYDRFTASVMLADSGFSVHFVSASIVELDLDDVRLVVLRLEADPGRRALDDPDEKRVILATALSLAIYLRLEGSVAVAWVDAEGATQWIAEPQQLPFLRSIEVGQICAQQICMRQAAPQTRRDRVKEETNQHALPVPPDLLRPVLPGSV